VGADKFNAATLTSLGFQFTTGIKVFGNAYPSASQLMFRLAYTDASPCAIWVFWKAANTASVGISQAASGMLMASGYKTSLTFTSAPTPDPVVIASAPSADADSLLVTAYSSQVDHDTVDVGLTLAIQGVHGGATDMTVTYMAIISGKTVTIL